MKIKQSDFNEYLFRRVNDSLMPFNCVYFKNNFFIIKIATY